MGWDFQGLQWKSSGQALLRSVSFLQVEVSLSNPPCAPWEQDLALSRGLPLTPTPSDVSEGCPVTMNCWRLLRAGVCEGRGSFAMPVALPPPTTCAGKREAGAACPAPRQSQQPCEHGGTRCPSDLGGKRLCKRNCKEYKPSEPSKNTFYFFSLFELNGKKQILSPSQMGHGVLAHY